MPFQIGILGSLGQIYQSLQQGTYPIDFDKWLGLSTPNMQTSLIIIYTLQGPQTVKGRYRHTRLAYRFIQQDDGSYNFY